MKPKILVVDDDRKLLESLQRTLASESYDIHAAADTAAGLQLTREHDFDVIITDLQLPGPHGVEINAGLDLIHDIHQSQPQVPIILMTGHHTSQTAIEATKRGAYDYILKPFKMPEMLAHVAGAVARKRLTKPVDLGDGSPEHDAIVGRSQAMQNVYKEIGRVAAKPVSVLIRGETGTGKELIARAICQHSGRAHQPFILVNCAAIPETLLESELFGHEQGSFTGASTRRIGRFEQAHQGTILLDEIGDISLGTQAKLLRVLQDKSFHRLGGREIITVDVRIIAATHRDLETAIQEDKFREDLYFRLNDVAIFLPPLRERREDIGPLIDHFLRRYAAEFAQSAAHFTPEAREFLEQQPWPGNVRELRNVVRKSLLNANGFAIGLENVRRALGTTPLPGAHLDQSLANYIGGLLAAATRGELVNPQQALFEAVERELYTQALRMTRNNQVKAAELLGVSRPTLREKLRVFGLLPTSEDAGG